MRGGYLMSSRVGVLKWLGALQLIHGLLLFILTLVYFAIDFEQNSTAALGGLPEYIRHVLFTIPTILLALGAGAAGSSMSRYQGLIHNISAKNAGVPLATMNGFSAMMTMIYSGTLIFFDIDKTNVLDDNDTKSWKKAVIALIIINFILSFFDMLAAFAYVTLGILWMPSESNVGGKPSSLPPRPAPEPYMPDVKETYYRNAAAARYGYGNPGYYGNADPYYTSGYRTLPALKY